VVRRSDETARDGATDITDLIGLTWDLAVLIDLAPNPKLVLGDPNDAVLIGADSDGLSATAGVAR